MTRKLRILSLAIVAVLALCVTSASAAQIHTGAAPAKLEGEGIGGGGKNFLETEVGALECEQVSLTGTQSATTAASVTLHPEYSECELFGLETTVDTTGCNYVIGAEAEGTAELECSTGNDVSITVLPEFGEPFCTFTLTPQDPPYVETYTNYTRNGIMYLHVHWHVRDITYNIIGGGGLCGSEGTRNGTLTDTITEAAFKPNGEPIDLTLN